jgi:hypothetical protein
MYITSLQLIVYAYYHNVDAFFNSSWPLKNPFYHIFDYFMVTIVMWTHYLVIKNYDSYD